MVNTPTCVVTCVVST